MRLRMMSAALAAATMLAVSAGPMLAQGDTLRVTRVSDFPTCFHPVCFATGNQYMNFQLLFNSLVKVDADESTYIPDLADTWDVSPDATEFTFQLNPDAKWHDGTPVTADDVIYTAATGAQMADAYVGTYPIDNWLSVEGAADVLGTTDIPVGLEKIDDHTVKFTLAAPNALFLRSLVDPAYMIMPKHILEGMTVDELKASDFVNGVGTIGSGPYKLVNYTPDVGIEYEANAEYHKGAPNIPNLIFALGVSADTAAAQLLNDELDIVFDLKPSDFAVLDGQDGINAARVPGIGVQFIQFNAQNPATSDPRVRQAMAYGFDRRTLLETVFEGAGSLLWGPPAFDQDDPELDRYEFDPEKAEALLAEAEADGWDRGQPLRLIYIQEEPGWPEIAAAFANDMTALGLNVVLEPSDGAGWQARLPFPGDYEISLQCCGSFFHPDRNSSMFSTEAPAGTFYGNPEVEQGFKDARATGSPEEQAAIYQNIARILNEASPYIYMWFVANTHANSTDVQNFTYYPNARESFSQIEKWTLAE